MKTDLLIYAVTACTVAIFSESSIIAILENIVKTLEINDFLLFYLLFFQQASVYDHTHIYLFLSIIYFINGFFSSLYCVVIGVFDVLRAIQQ